MLVGCKCLAGDRWVYGVGWVGVGVGGVRLEMGVACGTV